MGEVKDLHSQDGLEKLKELAESIDFCMMCTCLQEIPFETRPMSTQEVDLEGSIWFMSSIGSHKNEQLEKDSRVQLLYSDPGKSHFLTVYGKAEIIKDRERTAELWNVFLNAWFQKGKDDPDITLIRVVPQAVHYWDTKHGKIVYLLKTAVAAVSGNAVDDGIEGDINV